MSARWAKLIAVVLAAILLSGGCNYLLCQLFWPRNFGMTVLVGWGLGLIATVPTAIAVVRILDPKRASE